MFRGKKYQESAKLIDRSVQYDPNEKLLSGCESDT